MAAEETIPPEVQSDAPAPAAPTLPETNLKEFLENEPPGRDMVVPDGLVFRDLISGGSRYKIKQPMGIELYCEVCEGVRHFQKVQSGELVVPDSENPIYIVFICRNCTRARKLYSLMVYGSTSAWIIRKLAELPDFGPPIPARVISLIGGERDYYLKGRRCENQGLGIGAFVYYRRVVDNQKNRILDAIIKASKRIGIGPDVIAELEAAKSEIQFSMAIDRVRHAVPQALLIKGHNPLTLLHSALSEGLHALEEEECLERAATVRLVLTELAERIGSVLKDQAELDAAVTKLMAAKAKKPVAAE